MSYFNNVHVLPISESRAYNYGAAAALKCGRNIDTWN